MLLLIICTSGLLPDDDAIAHLDQGVMELPVTTDQLRVAHLDSPLCRLVTTAGLGEPTKQTRAENRFADGRRDDEVTS